MTRARDLADIIGPNGDLVVAGDLQVTGTTTTVNSTTVEIADNNILLGSGATTNAQNTGAGLSVLLPDASPDEFATLVYTTSSDSWSFNKNVGIGIDSPGSTLHIDSSTGGIVRVSRINTNANEYGQIEHDGTDTTIKSTGATKFYNSTDYSMTIYDSGTLAIGAGASSNYLLSTNYDANATFSNAVSDFTQMWQNSGTNMLGVAGADDLSVRLVTNNGYALAFNNAGTEAFRITTGGNIEAPSGTSGNFEIGIEDNATDTFRTSAKGLIIKGNDAYTGASPQQASAGGDVEVRAGFGVDNTGVGAFAGDLTLSGGIPYTGNSSGAGQIFLKTNNTEVLTVSRDQKVGIGTASPSTPLHILHGNLSAEPYSGLYIQNTTSTGDAYTGVTVDGVLQSHYRYMLNGSLKWQTRVGHGLGTDDFRIYSWTSATDIVTIIPTGNGALSIGGNGQQYEQWTDTGANTGSVSINGYSSRGGTQNPYIGHSANTGEYAMYYMNRIYNGATIGFDNSSARYFDYYRDGSSKMRTVISSNDEFGYYMAGGSEVTFNIWRSGGVNALRVDDNGLIHLGGNTDPSHKGLSIYKSTNDSYTPNNFNNESLLRLHTANAEGNYAGITYTHEGATEFFTGLVRPNATSDITDYVFQGYNGNTNAYQEYMRIDASGNVGIGTESPQMKLQVNGANQTFAAHFGQGTANTLGDWGGISLGYSESTNNSYRKVGIAAKAIGDGAARQELHFLVDSNSDGGNADINDSKMRIDINGNVGIGTGSPAAKLHVDGDLIANGPVRYFNYLSSARGFLEAEGSYSLLGNDSSGNADIEITIVFKNTSSVYDTAMVTLDLTHAGNTDPMEAASYFIKLRQRNSAVTVLGGPTKVFGDDRPISTSVNGLTLTVTVSSEGASTATQAAKVKVLGGYYGVDSLSITTA